MSPEQRRGLLAEFEGSGESATGFARRTGLKYSTLAGWLQRHRQTQPLKRTPPLRLLEAMVATSPAPANGPLLVLQLPGGVRVEVADEKQAALAAILLRELARPC